MTRSRLESREDRLDELGPLEVVGDGEGPLRKAVLTDDAAVSRDAPSIATPVGAVVLEAEAPTRFENMRGALLPRAKARHEPPLDFDGLNRPVHGPG